MNDIDLMMAKNPLDSDFDEVIDKIIAHHRAIREKPQKTRAEEVKLDLSTIINLKPKPQYTGTFKRRV